MGLGKIFERNPLKKLTRNELRDMELGLKVKSNKLTQQVSELDAEIQALFEKAKEAKSHLEEVNIASRIKTLGNKKQSSVAAHSEMEKTIRAVSNVLIIREYETDLKAVGAWKVLEKIPPA